MKWSKNKEGNYHTNQKDEGNALVRVKKQGDTFHYTITIKRTKVKEHFGYKTKEEAMIEAEKQLNEIYEGVSCILAGCQ